MFASSLSSMFELLDINENCYGVGYLSKLVASELANLPSARGRRKVTRQKQCHFHIELKCLQHNNIKMVL